MSCCWTGFKRCLYTWMHRHEICCGFLEPIQKRLTAHSPQENKSPAVLAKKQFVDLRKRSHCTLMRSHLTSEAVLRCNQNNSTAYLGIIKRKSPVFLFPMWITKLRFPLRRVGAHKHVWLIFHLPRLSLERCWSDERVSEMRDSTASHPPTSHSPSRNECGKYSWLGHLEMHSKKSLGFGVGYFLSRESWSQSVERTFLVLPVSSEFMNEFWNGLVLGKPCGKGKHTITRFYSFSLANKQIHWQIARERWQRETEGESVCVCVWKEKLSVVWTEIFPKAVVFEKRTELTPLKGPRLVVGSICKHKGVCGFRILLKPRAAFGFHYKRCWGIWHDLNICLEQQSPVVKTS